MSSSKLKDIGLCLNDKSIFDIISYKNNTIHPILQAAVTIMFFSPDTEFRGEYNGIYHLLGQANSAILPDLELDLSHISFALTQALQQTYPEVLKTEFITTITGSTLNIVLNISTTDDTLSTVVYIKDLD
jgi:hypothetical protein